MPVHYVEYDVYRGDGNTNQLKLTDNQFEDLLARAKQAIKDDEPDELEDYIIRNVSKGKLINEMMMVEALTNFCNSPRRPQSIKTALNKKGVFAEISEDGSYAFSSKGVKLAKQALAKIEAKELGII